MRIREKLLLLLPMAVLSSCCCSKDVCWRVTGWQSINATTEAPIINAIDDKIPCSQNVQNTVWVPVLHTGELGGNSLTSNHPRPNIFWLAVDKNDPRIVDRGNGRYDFKGFPVYDADNQGPHSPSIVSLKSGHPSVSNFTSAKETCPCPGIFGCN